MIPNQLLSITKTATPILEIPAAERPRERCLSHGAACLSLRECLALILGTGPRNFGCLGLAALMLERAGTGLPPAEEERAFFSAMESSASALLADLPGLGSAAKGRILAAFELGRRYAYYREKSRSRPAFPTISGKEPLFEALKRLPDEFRHAPKEWLGFVPFYRTGIGEFCCVERGVRTHVNVDPAELFARLLALRPGRFVLFHNHPSGSLLPSRHDQQLTDQVARVALDLGLELIGHWIVTAGAEHLMFAG